MSERIDIAAAAQRLRRAEDVLILCHKNPDGDTLGSAGALFLALRAMGKTSAVLCSDPIHERFSFMGFEEFYSQFTPRYVVAVDIAGQQLFGAKTAEWADRVNLCIDHHGSNTGYADAMLLDDTAAATCEIVYDILTELGADIDARIADCLYTGVSTDTGCFKFANTTARTHRLTARLIELGSDPSTLNELLFENMSRQRIAVDLMALSSLEYHYGGACAMICLTRKMIEETGAAESDLEGITAMPRTIEGVLVGITLRQQPGGSYKVSIRTRTGIDATDVVRGLGGGGHKNAAGCEIIGGLEYAKRAVLAEAKKVLPRRGGGPGGENAG